MLILHDLPFYNTVVLASSVHSRSSCRKCAASCFASAENWPCFQRARLERARPAAVVGPVDNPPCSLQRPFRIAGHWHGVPFRVRAPHRGALLRFPEGLPFLSNPHRFTWGSFAVLLCIPTPHPPVDRPYNRLTASLHGDVLNGHRLFSPASMRP